MVKKGRHTGSRKTHCVRGHPLSGANLLVRPQGWRACRECQRAHYDKWKPKRPESRAKNRDALAREPGEGDK
jgi:hypothetical protein